MSILQNIIIKPMPKFNIHSCIIVENENASVERLQGFIELYFKEIDLIHICKTAAEAIKVLPEIKPDLIFMDVYLDGTNTCFDVLDNIPWDDFKIIFVTKSDKHAEQAFEYNSVEYIKKPYTLDDLKSAIKKAGEMGFAQNADLAEARDIFTEEIRANHKCNLKSDETIIRRKFNDIFLFKGAGSQNNYSMVYFEKDDFSMVSKITSKRIGLLKDYHDLPNIFFKTRSYYINTTHIAEVRRPGYIVYFSNGQQLKISRNAYYALLELFKFE